MTASCPLPSTSEPSREEQARALCLRLLTARARTRAELAGQLAKRGYPDDVSTRVLDRLADVGLVDDADFAEQWVHSRLANAGKGKRALAAELHTKGVDNDVITSVLGGINPAAERGRAEELVRKKLRRENLSDEAADARVTRRLVGMLARRGFSAGAWPTTWSASSWPASGSAGASSSDEAAAFCVPTGQTKSLRGQALRRRCRSQRRVGRRESPGKSTDGPRSGWRRSRAQRSPYHGPVTSMAAPDAATAGDGRPAESAVIVAGADIPGPHLWVPDECA